ncbi:MAG: hypothetical protein ACR2MT_17345, partial [Aurantibacter sp.]
LCDIPLKHKIDGESFADIMYKDVEKKDDVAYGYFKRGITLRTKEYRLTKYFRGEEPTIELYDHSSGSREQSNIAVENPEVVEKLLPLLEEGNTGLYQNSQQK